MTLPISMILNNGDRFSLDSGWTDPNCSIVENSAATGSRRFGTNEYVDTDAFRESAGGSYSFDHYGIPLNILHYLHRGCDRTSFISNGGLVVVLKSA